MHRCGFSRECCFIAPPFLLARLAEEGTTEQRRAAVRTLGGSVAISTRRAMLSELARTRGVNIADLFPAARAKNRDVYDVRNGGWNDLPGGLVRSEGGPPSDDDAVNEAYDGADATYAFYK
jgi:Zn-dependent metalloprotease